MFDDIRKGLTADKEAFAEQVKDSFGQSVVSQVYEPCQRETALLAAAWEEAELQRREIMALTFELRTVV